MSFGLPVIGGKHSGGVPWVLDYGKAGLLANISNPSEMAKKMNTLLEDKQLYLKVNNQSIQRIKDLFTQDAVATAYEAVYLKILRDKQ